MANRFEDGGDLYNTDRDLEREPTLLRRPRRDSERRTEKSRIAIGRAFVGPIGGAK